MEEHCNEFSDASESRIKAAANLFWWIHLSLNGSFESGIATANLDFSPNVNKIREMLSASLVLQKAIITRMDCIEFARKYANNKNVQL